VIENDWTTFGCGFVVTSSVMNVYCESRKIWY